jgi:nitrite reductase/ring-hydroxylating ferredoxin subunit
MTCRRQSPSEIHDLAPLPPPSRRGALRLAGALVAGATGCAPPFPEIPAGPIAAGSVMDLPAGAFAIVQHVVVARDAAGFYAMSALCTHDGCWTQPTPDAGELFCPCHGSLFDRTGAVVRGPARAPLPHYRVDLGPAGSVIVQAGVEVALDARTPVP